MRLSEGRIALRKIFLFGAGARNRNGMPLRTGDFESEEDLTQKASDFSQDLISLAFLVIYDVGKY
jgi:hypothetical protein